jgi:hypothetical protein
VAVVAGVAREGRITGGLVPAATLDSLLGRRLVPMAGLAPAHPLLPVVIIHPDSVP